MQLKFVGTREHPNGVKVSGRICTTGVVFTESDGWIADSLLARDGFVKVEDAIEVKAAPKKKRGRPRKVKAEHGNIDQSGNADADTATPGSAVG